MTNRDFKVKTIGGVDVTNKCPFCENETLYWSSYQIDENSVIRSAMEDPWMVREIYTIAINRFSCAACGANIEVKTPINEEIISK